MKAKLYKTEKENYVLVDSTKGTYDDGYMLGTSRESQYNKLSIKNCEAIERGYDLDELADEYAEENAKDDNISYHNLYTPIECAYRYGFQKALEILGDKKFSEEDVKKTLYLKNGFDKDGFSFYKSDEEIIQSLQQTEWEVEIEMEQVAIGDKYTPEPKPKLDADGCLILKLKSE